MKPRIAVALDAWSYPFNGTVVSTRRFVSALSGDFDFRVLATPSGETPDIDTVAFPKLSVPGFNQLIDSMRVPLSRPVGRRVRAALDGCALLHVQFPFLLGRSAIIAARRLGIPVVSSFHVQPENILRNVGLSSPTLNRALYRLFVGAIYDRSDLVIAPSDFAAELLVDHGLRAPVRVLSNGVPRAFFDLHGGERRHDGDTFEVLSVGRLAREKQHRVLLEAIGSCRLRERIRLRIIGTGPLETELRRLGDTLGIDATIGPASNEELMARYAAADLFVHTGEIELEGMSVTEAMASGNAVLVSDSMSSAARYLVTDPDAVFRTGDPHDLARRVDRFLEQPERRIRAAIDNHSRALVFAHERSANELAAIYRSLAGLPASGK